MAARSRITVLLLLFLLSTEHSFAVDQNKLASLVKELLSNYRFNGMFSLAVSIPQNQNQDQNQNQNQDQNQNKNQYKNQNQGANRIIQEVLKSDPADDVKNKINMGEVYVGSRMVAAKVLKRKKGADHAESRVVDKLDQLYNSTQFNQEDVLLFYVFASPCVEKCTSYGHTENILSRINNIQRWNNYAVVFSKIFKPRNGRENTDQERIEALERLATFKGERGPIGLENIFRCDRKENKPMQCVSCSCSNGQVAHECVSDKPPSATTNICPQPGTGDSSSQRGVQGNMDAGTGDSSSQSGVQGNMDAGTGDSSSQSGAQGNMDAGRGSDDGNGSDLRTAEDVSSPQIGFDYDFDYDFDYGKVSRGKGGKGRRGKGGKGKGRRGKGRKGKGRKGKGRKGKGRKGKGRCRKGGKGGEGGKGGKGGEGGKGGKGKGRSGKGGEGGEGGKGGKGQGREGRRGKGKGSRRGGGAEDRVWTRSGFLSQIFEKQTNEPFLNDRTESEFNAISFSHRGRK